jgi:hypothetical protein
MATGEQFGFDDVAEYAVKGGRLVTGHLSDVTRLHHAGGPA